MGTNNIRDRHYSNRNRFRQSASGSIPHSGRYPIMYTHITPHTFISPKFLPSPYPPPPRIKYSACSDLVFHTLQNDHFGTSRTDIRADSTPESEKINSKTRSIQPENKLKSGLEWTRTTAAVEAEAPAMWLQFHDSLEESIRA